MSAWGNFRAAVYRYCAWTNSRRTSSPNTMSILDLLGGLFLTCIFVVFLFVLLKIIRAVMIVGVKNEELNTEGEGEEEAEDLAYDDNDDDEGEGSSTTPTATSSSASKGTSDPDYWLDAKTDKVYELPCPARLSYSVEKPIIVRANDIGVFGKNGSRIAWVFSKPENNSNIQDDDDLRLFKLHYFDLKNFKPSETDMVKPHWERTESYVVLQCASGGFLHSDMSTEYPSYGLDVTLSALAVTDTNYTDDRFFSVHVHHAEAGVKHLYLKHLTSGYMVSVKGGFAEPVPTLKYMSSGPSDVELFFFENRPEDNPADTEGGEEEEEGG